MQDPNNLIFETEMLKDPKELFNNGNASSLIVPEEIADQLSILDSESPFVDPNAIPSKTDFEDGNVPKISLSVKDDIAAQKQHAKNKLKADIFNTLFNNEMQLYFDEHKHVMPSKEKKRLKAILIKKIDKGDIYVNKVGKLIIRKGKNK